jgi:hypothetical protein
VDHAPFETITVRGVSSGAVLRLARAWGELWDLELALPANVAAVPEYLEIARAHRPRLASIAVTGEGTIDDAFRRAVAALDGEGYS